MEGKTTFQRQAIIDQYKEQTGLDLSHSISSRFPYDSTARLRGINVLMRQGDGAADQCGAIAVAFEKYKNAYDGSSALKEIRSILASRSAEEMEQIKTDLPQRLAQAGLPKESLDQLIGKLREPNKEICQIFAKGADNLDKKVFCKLSEIALKNKDLDFFLETWKLARPEDRKAYLADGAAEKIDRAFNSAYDPTRAFGYLDWTSKSGSLLEVGKAMDVLELGFVGADKFVRESSGYITGDFENQIDMALRNMPVRERELFNAGEKICARNPDGINLQGEQKLGYERYTKIMDSLLRAGYPAEVFRWEELAKGGGLIAELADKNGMLYDAATHDVMKTIENMTVADFEKLRRDPTYKMKVQDVLRTFADGSERDPKSELGRCFALLEQKSKVEADRASMTPSEKKSYELGRALFKAGEGASLSKEQQNSLDFYRQRTFEASTNLAKRSIFDVIDDNQRFYHNNTGNIFDALSCMRPDERKMCQIAQDGKADQSKLSSEERKQYQAAIEFRAKLDRRLDDVLDRGLKPVSSTDILHGVFSRADCSERNVAKSILERIGNGKDGNLSLIDKLNVHANHIQPDRAKVASDIKDALSKNPELAALGKVIAQAGSYGNLDAALTKLDPERREAATKLVDAMRRSMGGPLFAEHGLRILDGNFSAADQLSLRLGKLSHDKVGMLHDLESFSQVERSQLAAFLSPEKMKVLLDRHNPAERTELKMQAQVFNSVFESLNSYEKTIFENATKTGMQPEDWLRFHCGDALDGSNEKGVKEVLAKLVDREAVKNELGQKPEFKGSPPTDTMITLSINQKLSSLSGQFAQKYGMDLKDTLISELGGEDLKRSLQLARKQYDKADDIVFNEQRDFFKNMGLGADLVDYLNYGASTSIGLAAFDNVTAAQAHERMGLGAFESEEAREASMQLFEASLEMTASQTELSDAAIDTAINIGCLLATVPSAGTSLAAMATRLGASSNKMLKTLSGVLQAMDTAAQAGTVANKTEAMASWFAKASKAEQMIALGIVGGSSKVGFKTHFAGDYDLKSQGYQDFLSGFTDMALNVDIPLGKWGRSAAGRSCEEMSQLIARNSSGAGTELSRNAGQFSKDGMVKNFEDVMKTGIENAAQRAMEMGGKVEHDAVDKLAASLIKEGHQNREQLVHQLGAALEQSINKTVSQDLKLSKAMFEAIVASRQGALSGALGSLAYMNPDQGLEQNFASLAMGATAGAGMNLAMSLPIEIAGSLSRQSTSRHTSVSSEPHPRIEVGRQKSSVGETGINFLTETDRNVHETGKLVSRLEQGRKRMSPAEIAHEEAVIAEQIQNIVRDSKVEAKLHLQKRLGISEADAQEISDDLEIRIGKFDEDDGTSGIMHGDTGVIELRMGPDLPKDRSTSQTFLHEFEHLVNSTRYSMLLQTAPDAAVNALVDDCLKGVLSGGKRLENVPGAQFIDETVKQRLSSNKFSRAEQDFVKQQLKDYLCSNSAEGKVAKDLSVQELSSWLKNRQSPAIFPNPANEQLLLKEMVGEIENANTVFSAATLSQAAESSPSVKKLMAALQNSTSTSDAAMKHYFNGVHDTTLGIGDTSMYKFSSPEEIAANRAPVYRAYQESGRALVTEIGSISNNLAQSNLNSPRIRELVAEVQGIADSIAPAFDKIAKEREKFVAKFIGDDKTLAKELKQFEAKERKAVRDVEQAIFERLNTEEGKATLDMLKARPQFAASANVLLNAIEARSSMVPKLQELTAQEMYARSVREISAVSGSDILSQAAASKKYEASLENLLRKTSDEKLNETLEYINNQGLVSPAKLLRIAPAERLGKVIESLKDGGMSAKDILESTPALRVESAAYELLNAPSDNRAMYQMLFEGSTEKRAGVITAIKQFSKDKPTLASAKFEHFLDQSESSGRLSEAVDLLRRDAKIEDQIITASVGGSLELKVKSHIEATGPLVHERDTTVNQAAPRYNPFAERIAEAMKSNEFVYGVKHVEGNMATEHACLARVMTRLDQTEKPLTDLVIDM